MDLLSEVPHYPTHQKMLEIAEKLAQPFAYARIDFYSVGGQIYFGEITHYTGAGIEKLDSYEIDWALGLLWKKEYRDKNLVDCLNEVVQKRNKVVTLPS